MKHKNVSAASQSRQVCETRASYHSAIKNDSRAILRFFELALMLARLDHVASVIGNANRGIMRAAVMFGVSDCVRDGVGSPYHSRPNGSAAEMRSTPR